MIAGGVVTIYAITQSLTQNTIDAIMQSLTQFQLLLQPARHSFHNGSIGGGNERDI